MAKLSLAKAKSFVVRYKWFFAGGLVLLLTVLTVLTVLTIMPRILKGEGLGACGAGMFWDRKKKPKAGCECLPGTRWNGQWCSRCSIGKVWDAARKKCVCGGKSEWDAASKKCVTCGTGMFWDWNKKPRAGCECAPGTSWNGTYCQKSTTVKATAKQDCHLMVTDTGASLRAVKGGLKKTNVRATYHPYGDAADGANAYGTSSLACADFIGNTFDANGPTQTGKNLLKYPWTAFCINREQVQAGKCGKCMRITNRENGVSTVVRVVDNGGCSGRQVDASGRQVDGDGLDLQPCAFNAIDSSGKQGYLDGHLFVDVEEVECGPGGVWSIKDAKGNYN